MILFIRVFAILCIMCAPLVLIAASTTISFQLVDKLIVIQARVDGRVGNFILDTGVPYLMLNAKYFKGKPVDKNFYGLNGQTGKVAIRQVGVEIEANSWKSVYAEIISMDLLERSKNLAIHGLLGMNLFRNYELSIDVQNQEITLRPLSGKSIDQALSPDLLSTASFSFKCKGRSPIIKAQVGQIDMKFMIDTGAEINILHEKYEEKLQDYINGSEDVRLKGLGKKIKTGVAGKLSQIKIGGYDCQPMKALFISMNHLNQNVSGPLIDGILGYEFLKQFLVTINFKKRKLYFRPYEQSDGVALSAE